MVGYGQQGQQRQQEAPSTRKPGSLRCPGGAGRPSQLLNRRPARPRADRPEAGRWVVRSGTIRQGRTASVVEQLQPVVENIQVVGPGHLRTRRTPCFEQARRHGCGHMTERPQSAPAAERTGAATSAAEPEVWTVARRQYIWRSNGRPVQFGARRRHDGAGAPAEAAEPVDRNITDGLCGTSLKPIKLMQQPTKPAVPSGSATAAYLDARVSPEVAPRPTWRAHDSGSGQNKAREQAPIQDEKHRYSFAPPWSARNTHRLTAGHYEKVRLHSQQSGVKARLRCHSCSEDAVFRKSDAMKYIVP